MLPTSVPSARTAPRKIPITDYHTVVSLRSLLEVDVISLLAARSGVHPSTVAAQLTAWSVGGSR